MPPATQSSAPASKPNPKVLRLGLIREGKVSERITKIGEVVGVGESQRNLFVITDTKLGQRVEMFIPQREGYLLQVPEWVEGMIQTKDGMKSLADLRSTAQKKGELWVYLLDERMRGKLVIGNNSILFQFVPAPPQPERVMSASDFRAKFYDDEDPLFLSLLGTFSIAATLFLAFIAVSPRPDDADLVDVEDVIKLIDKPLDEVIPPPPTEDVADKGDKPAEDKPAEAKPKADDTPHSPSPNQSAQPSAAQTVQQHSLLLQALGTTGVGTSGDTALDILGDQATMAGLDKALAGVTGVEQANASNVGAVREGGQNGRGNADVGVATGTVGEVNTGTAVAVKVKKPMVEGGDVDADVESGDPSGIKSVVSKRRGSFESCDTTALKQNPDLKGRITIGWTITGGKVSNVHVAANTTGDDTLATCFATVVRGLRFGDDVSATIDGYTWAVSGS